MRGRGIIIIYMHIIGNQLLTCGCPPDKCRHVSDIGDSWSVWRLSRAHGGCGHLSHHTGTVKTIGVINGYSHPVGSEG